MIRQPCLSLGPLVRVDVEVERPGMRAVVNQDARLLISVK